MLLKLNIIIIYLLVAFFVSLMIYPIYIHLLRKFKIGKEIREDAVTGDKAEIFKSLHGHKKGTPTMGGGVILFVTALLVLFSYILKNIHIGLDPIIKHSLISSKETYIILFAFFSMGLIGLFDDYLNIKGKGKIKGLSAKVKLFWMFAFSAFISYWFFYKLGIDYINFWPFSGEISLGYFYLIFTFIFTVAIVNAINITDGLDGLVGGLMLISLGVMAIITFSYGWFLATTVIAIVLGSLLAFLWFNINPAKIFMGDSGALALGGLVSSLIYLLNIKMGIFIPFLILFGIVWLELGSSFLQIFWKKVFKRKLFPIAPFHHYLEYLGDKEHSIVMKMWLINGVLASITLILVLYQLAGV